MRPSSKMVEPGYSAAGRGALVSMTRSRNGCSLPAAKGPSRRGGRGGRRRRKARLERPNGGRERAAFFVAARIAPSAVGIALRHELAEGTFVSLVGHAGKEIAPPHARGFPVI